MEKIITMKDFPIFILKWNVDQYSTIGKTS